jgi:murein DD-endopeptidase MepM/ murein hydrolase activator NlpD
MMRKAGGAVHGQGNPCTKSIFTASFLLLLCTCLSAVPQPVAAKEPAKVAVALQAPHSVRSPVKADEPAVSSSSPQHDVTTRQLVLRKGDTLLDLLIRAGISRSDAFAAMQAVQDIYDVRRLQPGENLVASTDAAGEPGGKPVLRALHLETGPQKDLTVVRGEDGRFATSAAGAPRAVSVEHRDLVIESDVKHSLAAAHVPAAIATEVAKVSTLDPDFPKKPKAGARLSLVYESAAAGTGDEADVLRYVALQDGAKLHQIYRFAFSDSLVAFVDKRGVGTGEVSLADPVKDARMSSGFGWRVHPVLGVRKFHYGVDFAAPAGTPVHAAADGIVEEVGWRGANGRYIRIRHDDRLTTTYSHLKGFAANLRRGSQVSRDQVIAYVGRTGLATGPHLYYEVLVDGRQVDPLQPKVLAVRLHDAELAKFRRFIQLTARVQ